MRAKGCWLKRERVRKMDDRIKRIADHYGRELQEMQAIEEMAELTQAINKFRRKPGEQTFENLIEEIADTQIMLEQLTYLHHINTPVNMCREDKLERQIERIEPKMVTIIGGIHGIHYYKDYKTYYWRVACDDEFKPGDLAIVHTKNGIERVLVLKVKKVPESEAARCEKAVAKVVFNSEQQE